MKESAKNSLIKKKKEKWYITAAKGALFIILNIVAVFLFIIIVVGVYVLGLVRGYQMASEDASTELATLQENNMTEDVTPTSTSTPSPTLVVAQDQKKTSLPTALWGGPDLWEAVNARRVEFGVNPLQSRDDLCTIASIRLNELLELGKLDAHEGFSNMREERPDLAYIFDNYSAIAEFLAYGGQTAEETVDLWQNTLGHRKLLEGGEYVWGCVYAQNTFAVAITAY
jgi:uncharacterized protein YkwD